MKKLLIIVSVIALASSAEAQPGFSYTHPSDVPDSIYYFEITPSKIDTSLYRAPWLYWTKDTNISCAVFGTQSPLGLSNFTHKGLVELQGLVENKDSFRVQAHELYTDGTSKKIAQLPPKIYWEYHADGPLFGDGSWQRLNSHSDSMYVFTQRTQGSFPDSMFTTFPIAPFSLANQQLFASFDGDDEYDYPAIDRVGSHDFAGLWIFEFDKSSHKFNVVWKDSMCVPYGPAMADFNRDGKNELVMGNASAEYKGTTMSFIQNEGDNQYRIYQHETSIFQNFPNDMFCTAGDIDGDSYPEAIGAIWRNDPNGQVTRFWAFERKPVSAGGTDSFRLIQSFQFNEVGANDGPAYIVADVTGDGVPELCIQISKYFWVFTKDGDNKYKLLYVMPRGGGSPRLWDFDGDGKLDYVRGLSDSTHGWSEFYLYGKSSLGVRDEQAVRENNFSSSILPQPLQNKGMLLVDLPTDDILSIDIYDVVGRKIQTLASDQKFFAGTNRIPLILPTSGMYSYRIHSEMYGIVIGKIMNITHE